MYKVTAKTKEHRIFNTFIDGIQCTIDFEDGVAIVHNKVIADYLKDKGFSVEEIK